jgi:hypothetical protein
MAMSERSEESAESEQDEELTLEKEMLRDLDVTDEQAEEVQGGRNTQTCYGCI